MAAVSNPDPADSPGLAMGLESPGFRIRFLKAASAAGKAVGEVPKGIRTYTYLKVKVGKNYPFFFGFPQRFSPRRPP